MRGPYHSYISDYPNQVHQLNFFISKNHYLLKNDEIKYQSKKFDIDWKNYSKTGKRHLVTFLVRDHYSNCFYAEIYPIDEIPHIKDFLFRAWGKKRFEFCGIPKNLILGRHIIERFPGLQVFSQKIGLNIELAQNGFATGIISTREWENNLRFYANDYKTLKNLQENTDLICRDIHMRRHKNEESNLSKWVNNHPKGMLIDNKEDFDVLFETN